MRWLALAAVLTGCGVHSSRIGPYVTDVQRHGGELVISLCDVILEEGTLQTGACQEQRVPIAGLPRQALPAPPPAH